MSNVICIDCGAMAQAAYLRQPKDANLTQPVESDTQHPGDNGFLIMRCETCGSVFLHPDYYEESFAVYDSERYFSGYYPDNIHTGGGPVPTSNSSRLRRTLYRRKARNLLRAAGFQKPPLNVLEIGSGTGDLLGGMQDLGCKVAGVDVSDTALLARERGLDIRKGRLEDLSFPAASFDLIYAVQVFEHIPDMGSLLAKISELLTVTGRLLIVVPNDLESFRGLIFSGLWWMIPPMHVRYFNSRSLKTVFARHGFELEKLTTTGVLGDDVDALSRWYLKKAGLDGLLANPVAKAVRVGMTHGLLAPIDKALGTLGKHASYLAVYHQEGVGNLAR